MKQTFFILTWIFINFSIAYSQELHSIPVETKKHSSVKESNTNVFPIIKSLTKRNILSDLQSKEKISEELKASQSHSFVGIYDAEGYNYSDGKKVNWEVTVTQDNENPNKFWFKNIINKATVNNIYGILDNSSLFISFPVGQVTVPKENTEEKKQDAWFAAITEKEELRWGGSPVLAHLSIGQGTITFKEGFASVIVTYKDNKPIFTFFGAINATPPAIYTNKSGGTGEDDPVPASVYSGPEGILFLSMSKEWKSLGVNLAFAPAYSTWTFKNYTDPVPKLKYEWTYNAVPNPENPTEIQNPGSISNQRDLSYPVTKGMKFMPKLESIMPAESSEFTLGATNALNNPNAEGYTQAYIEAGGGSYYNKEMDRRFNLTNLNPDYDIYSWTFIEKNDYVFGTGPSCNCSSLVSFFEGNPNGFTYFEGVDVFFGKLTGPESIELKLEIVKAKQLNNGKIELGDIYGTAKLKISDKYVHEKEYGTLSFTDFYLETNRLQYLEIPGSFALVISGFNVPDVEFSVISELVDRPDKKNYSYIIDKDNGRIDYYLNARNTMYFSLINGAYSYIEADNDYINASTTGGFYQVEMTPYFPSLELLSSLPEWIKVNQINEEKEGSLKATIQITVDPLPKEVSGRSFILHYSTKGARKKIKVAQGDQVGVPEIQTPQVIIKKEGEYYSVSYPVQAKTLVIYSATGQKIASHPLKRTLKDQIPHSAWEKGIYIFRFEDINETIKVIK